MSERFRLTEQEKASPLWQRLKAHLVELLEDKRRANDRMRPIEETAKLRGEIAQIRYLIEAAAPQTEFAAGES